MLHFSDRTKWTETGTKIHKCINNLILYKRIFLINCNVYDTYIFPQKDNLLHTDFRLSFISIDFSTSCWKVFTISTLFLSGIIRMHLVWTNVLKSGLFFLYYVYITMYWGENLHATEIRQVYFECLIKSLILSMEQHINRFWTDPRENKCSER